MKVGDLVKRHDGKIGVVVSVEDFIAPRPVCEDTQDDQLQP